MTRFHGNGGSTLSSLFFTSSSIMMESQQQLQQIMFFALLLASLCVLFFYLYKKLKRRKEEDDKSTQNPHSIFTCPLPDTIEKTHQADPRIVELLTSNSPNPNWVSLISSLHAHLSVNDNGKPGNQQISDGSELDKGGGDPVGDQMGKKKKRRAKKKRQNSQAEDGGDDGFLKRQVSVSQDKNGLDCLYPFTSLSSVTQRKIKQQYDQLVKSHDSQALTLAQVFQFANCLIEGRNELQHKSEIIQRKFTIVKALLFKADRSSFDRLCQQIYRLEAEQKRLEEDVVVYNRLQQQLKLSPAYKKMLEIGASMDLKAGSGELVESTDTEFGDISFEELLAQEKKDSFWQKNGKLRSCTN